MVVGVEVNRFWTWDRLWNANRIRVVHGSLLELHRHSKNTEAGARFKTLDHNAELKHSYSYLQALLRISISRTA